MKYFYISLFMKYFYISLFQKKIVTLHATTEPSPLS